MSDKVLAEKSIHSGLEKEESGMSGRVIEILKFIKHQLKLHTHSSNISVEKNWNMNLQK